MRGDHILPRKYQQPAKRRKGRKQSRPNVPAVRASAKDVDLASAASGMGMDGLPLERQGANSSPSEAERSSQTDQPRVVSEASSNLGQMLWRDYSYVRADFRNFIWIAASVLVSLLVAATFLRWI